MKWYNLAGILALVGLLVGAFLVGRHTAPQPKVSAATKVDTKQTTTVHTDAKETSAATSVATTATHKVIYRDRWRLPDGTERERTVESTDTAAAQLETKMVEKIVEKIVTRDVIKKVIQTVEITPLKKQWRAGVTASVSPLQLNLLRPLDDLHVEVKVEHRLFGPIFGGVAVGTTLADPLREITVGVVLSAEF